MNDSLESEILRFVKSEYSTDPNQAIDSSTKLISSGLVDSFSMVSLKRHLERTYAIRIPDGQATPEAFDSVETIAALVRRFQG